MRPKREPRQPPRELSQIDLEQLIDAFPVKGGNDLKADPFQIGDVLKNPKRFVVPIYQRTDAGKPIRI